MLYYKKRGALMNDKIILEGAISVKAAIESKSREIISIYVDKNKKDRNISYIINVAKIRVIK